MADEKSYIEEVRMENADNGVIIYYTERCKRPQAKGNTYDSGYDYNPRKEVFDFDDDEGEEFQEAFDMYKELFLRARADRNKKK